MTVASCGDCTWEVDFLTPAAADKGLTAHRIRHHGETLPAVTQLASVVGWQQALEAARAVAATGQEFLLSDLPDVEHHKTNKGKLAAEIHRLGIAHPVAYAPSRRVATRGSAVKVWHADRDRCMDVDCVKAGRYADV